MKILFVTFNGINDDMFGGARASIRNYLLLQKHGDVDVYHIEKHSNFKSLLSLLELNYPPFRNNDIRKILIKINENNYDLIFFDSSLFGKLIVKFKDKGLKKIVAYQNCEIDYIKVRFGTKKTLKKIIYSFVARLNEKLSTNLADTCLCFSVRDSSRILEVYRRKVEYILPLSLEDKFYDRFLLKKEMHEKGKKACILFGPVGRANLEGFEWFLENVSPYIKCETFLIGNGFENYREKFESKKVHIVGFMEKLDEIYAMASCIAIPLFSGGGMKVKTGEALMFGKYIFGTTEAFEGYEGIDENIGQLCNSAKDFIIKINDYLEKDPEKFNAFSRKLYLENYSISSSEKMFEKMLKSI